MKGSGRLTHGPVASAQVTQVAVHFPPVSDLDEQYEEYLVTDLIHDSIISPANPPQVPTGDRQFRGVCRARIRGKRVNQLSKCGLYAPGELLEMSPRRRRELDLVGGHGQAL